MIPPPPPNGKPVALFDTECFPNYWTLKIRVMSQSGPIFSFSLRAGESFDQATILRIENLFALFTVVSFNGIYYDVPIIAAALRGFSCEQLKWLSDEIIVNGRKPWELGLATEWKPADHVDVMEVLPGAGSQKQYAGRIHCKTMRDLPFEPNQWLSEAQIKIVDDYCENDLSVLGDIIVALEPQRVMRDHLSKRYGIDLRSKSDAQMAEAVIKLRCEQALKTRIYKPEIDWNLKFRYEIPRWLRFQDEQLKGALELVKQSVFTLNGSGRVEMPAQLEGLEIPLGNSVYRLGIGGLHSKDKRAVYLSDENFVIRDNDVASYYPSLMLISGKYPPALGPVFLEILQILMNERLTAKDEEKALKKLAQNHGIEFEIVRCENEGGKVMINGTFGKTGSPYSILFAPEMMIQTTVTGQLALLMLIEWHEMQGIHVISANTDGMVIHCEREKVKVSKSIIDYWQQTTGLKMESTEYQAIYCRDVNNYFAILTPEMAAREGKPVKRKGEYSTAGLIEKKNPDVEICSDAVAEFLSNGTPILYTLAACRDIRKFVSVQKVSGGAVKLWGEGPRKGARVRDMLGTLERNGWRKATKADLNDDRGWHRKWIKNGMAADATTAYKTCFQPQQPELLGKVIRWYYGLNSPGPIIYNNSGDTVSLSYGSRPCMTLPDEFPADIDYEWYVQNCEKILQDVGYYDAHCSRCRSIMKGEICQNYGCEGLRA